MSQQRAKARGSPNGSEMGVRNYLIEGVSGTGKTTVATDGRDRTPAARLPRHSWRP